jgi:hypothetical protein
LDEGTDDKEDFVNGRQHAAVVALLEQLLAMLPPETVGQAMTIAVERLRLNPEKLALLIVRSLNPDEVLGASEEALLRGVTRKTLGAMKGRGELPKGVNA